MKNAHKDICLALGTVRYPPATFNKRFGNNLASIARQNGELSEKQIEWMFRLLYTYRKQIPRLYEKHKNNPLCSPPTPN